MKPLPMPLRIVAGLVATAVEEAQQLPRKLIELPVTAVSQALQATMRVQQRVTELAIKGDRALGALRPVPETPTWARFDEDDDEPPFGTGNGLAGTNWAQTPPQAPRRVVSPIPITRDIGDDFLADEEPADPPVVAADPRDEPAETVEVADMVAEMDAAGAAPPKTGAAPTRPAPARSTPSKATPSKATPSKATPSLPQGLEEYDSWSLPQLRGHFRSLSLEQVQVLLAWETSHQDRPPYVTMLSNRIASITGR